MAQWHIAQINVGHLLHPLDDPRMAGFTGQLDTINALADAAPGFVWRLQGDSGNATGIQVADDPALIVNLSVWEGVEPLFQFVYRTAHQGVMAGRRQWFARPVQPYQALWWVPAGHRPTPEEGLERLERLRREGPGPSAFGFKTGHPPPDNHPLPVDPAAPAGPEPAPRRIGRR